MEKYLNTQIKKLIEEFPEVGKILEKYNIGCVPCGVGSCLLKDIVEIHNLSKKDEEALLTRIAHVIYPGQKAAIPRLKRKQRPKPGEIRYSPPLARLVDEHGLIKQFMAHIPKILDTLDVKSAKGKKVILDSVFFIRSYADAYHHAKEEKILFTYFDEGLDILKVIREDHETARAHVRAILEGLEKRDAAIVREHLQAYHDLLTEHIKKEDEILYPWMDRNLTTSQVGELFSKFNEADAAADKKVIESCKKISKGRSA